MNLDRVCQHFEVYNTLATNILPA